MWQQEREENRKKRIARPLTCFEKQILALLPLNQPRAAREIERQFKRGVRCTTWCDLVDKGYINCHGAAKGPEHCYPQVVTKIKEEPQTDLLDTYTWQVLEVFAPWGMTRHVKVQRRDSLDGISWDDLQRIKNEALGADVIAVEVFPAEDQVVNEVNMRHLWEVPHGHIPSLK